jgi:Fur family transcriptional regulator, peroxide stress response regulator
LPKQKSRRMTRQRETILDIVRQTHSHPSADEIYELVRKQLPRISLGTVYRNLEVLAKMGLIQKLELGGTINRFDWDTNKHYHIRCLNCGQVDNAPIAPLNKLEDELYGATVFSIIGHRLEFEGLCPDCTEKEAQKVAAKTDLQNTN